MAGDGWMDKWIEKIQRDPDIPFFPYSLKYSFIVLASNIFLLNITFDDDLVLKCSNYLLSFLHFNLSFFSPLS